MEPSSPREPASPRGAPTTARCSDRGGGGGYVWWLAGLRVTLQTRYFLFICPQCVISTFRPGDTGQCAPASSPPGLGPEPASRPSPRPERQGGVLEQQGGGDTRAGPTSPAGTRGHSQDTVLKERTARAQPGGRWLPPRLSVPPAGLFLAGALPMAFKTPSGRDRCRGPERPAGERWVPASSPPTGTRPRPGQFAGVAVRRGGCDRVTGPGRARGGGTPHPPVYEVETPTPALLPPSDPSLDGGTPGSPPTPRPTREAARLGRSDRGRPTSEPTRLTGTLPPPKAREARPGAGPQKPRAVTDL